MKKSRRSFHTVVVVTGILCCMLLVYLGTRWISMSNTAYVYYVQEKDHDEGDIIALAKLHELLEKNFLDRDYYEAAAYTDIGIRWFANYNKEHQALLISGDPQSGWSYFFYATPEELQKIVDQKIPGSKLHHFLKPFPGELLMDCPTRSRDLFLFF